MGVPADKHALAVATALVVALALAAPAAATHVGCGDTITQDTTLDSDVVCGPNDADGLIIGASDVTLRLAGHAIRADPIRNEYGAAIRTAASSTPLTGLDIRRGTVSGFEVGLSLFADNTSVRRLDVQALEWGMTVYGNGAYAYRNSVYVAPSGPITLNGPGIHLWGDDAYAWGNVITGYPGVGVLNEGDRSRAVFNDVQSCDEYGKGVVAGDYTTSAVVNRNTVAGCYEPVFAVANDAGGGAHVRLNQTTGGLWGIRIDDPRAFVGRNTATGATWDGIFIERRAGATVQNNIANDNARHGINAVAGTIDGGGNTASGNGASPQCVNVACSSP
jgi:parallel beta-helix repeat protein